MRRIYLDACVIIYLIEGALPFQSRARARVTELCRDPSSVILTSLLSRIECRTKPIRSGDERLLSEYDAFFGLAHVLSLDITRDVVEKATVLRAQFGFKTPDAIHLSTAIVEGADLFVTGDEAFSKCAEFPVEVLKA